MPSLTRFEVALFATILLAKAITVLLAKGHNQSIPVENEYGHWPKKPHVFRVPGALPQATLNKAVGLKTINPKIAQLQNMRARLYPNRLYDSRAQSNGALTRG